MTPLYLYDKDIQQRFNCERLAWFDDGSVAIAWVVASVQSIRAFSAALQSNNSRARVEYQRNMLSRDPDGYRAYYHPLMMRTYESVVVSKRRGLLPTVSDNGLWLELKSERYTTPLLRDWVPFIRERLVKEKLLESLRCDGEWPTKPGLLTATTEDLDDIVKSGLACGHIKIEE